MTLAKPECFVIMPISDIPPYESGHFARVYEHLLKPAIEQAGYSPVRADDTVKTEYIVVGIIQKIVNCEMIVCDLSGRNPNVMYELGIRHAFSKPVVLIKDDKTDKTFDIQGLRHAEYDSTLRIDAVQKDILKIRSSVEETTNAGTETINSVVKLAGIKSAEVPADQIVSSETKLLLDALASIESKLNLADGKKERLFVIENDVVKFRDNTQSKIDDEVFGDNLASIGTLVDIHPSEEKIFIRNTYGKVFVFSASSVRSKYLSGNF